MEGKRYIIFVFVIFWQHTSAGLIELGGDLLTPCIQPKDITDLITILALEGLNTTACLNPGCPEGCINDNTPVCGIYTNPYLNFCNGRSLNICYANNCAYQKWYNCFQGLSDYGPALTIGTNDQCNMNTCYCCSAPEVNGLCIPS